MLVGKELGPFKITRELGSGAMGTVYQATYTKPGEAQGRVMAVKVLAIGAVSETAQKRFEREVEVLKQLKHPNIVRFYGSGKTSQGLRYYAMEYAEGESLDKVLARRGRFTWDEVVDLGKQLCSALQH